MEDVTARIIVTAESSMAVQGLNNVRKALDDVAEARMKELQLEKARAQLELAEFESARAAEKAYAAEIPLRGAERQLESLKEQHQAHIEMYKTKKKLGELDEKQNREWVRSLKKEAAEVDNLKMKVQELTKAYLPLANAEAGANLSAFNAKQKLDALGESTQNAAKKTEKFSWKMAGAKMASRLFSTDLGATSNNMIKYGILAAGAASAAKLVKWGFEQKDKAMIEEADLWKRNNENMKETAASWAEQRQKQNEALEALNGYNGKTQLSAVEQLKMAESLKVLKQGFGDLGIEIDRSTGKIANFDKVSVAYRRKMIEKEKSEIRAQLKNLENEKRAQAELRDTAGVPIWGGGVRIGGEATMLAAGREIERINSESAKLRKRMAELNRMKPDEEAEKLNAAKNKDAMTAFSDRRADIQREITLIELRNKGLEREAKWLEINARYDKERAKLQSEAERKAFDYHRPWLLESEMAKWDAEKKGKVTKQKKEERGISQTPLAKELFKYRAMAQGAIDANSAEGWRLQTRRLTAVDIGDPQKSSAESLKTVVKQGAETNAKLDNLNRQLTAITSSGVKLNAATRKY